MAKTVFWKVSIAAFLQCVLGSVGLSAEEPHVLHVGFQDTQPKYISEDGVFSGVCPDIYRAIEDRLEGRVRIVFPESFTPRRRILHFLERGSLHMDCGAGFSRQRASRFIFSGEPLYEVSHRLAVKAGLQEPPDSFTDLDERQSRIGVLPGTAVTRYLKDKIGGGPRLVPVQTPKEGLRLVSLGRLEGFYYHSLGLNYLLQQYEGAGTLRTTDHRFHVYGHWMMYSPQLDPSLIAMVEEALAGLRSDGTIAAILDAYSD